MQFFSPPGKAGRYISRLRPLKLPDTVCLRPNRLGACRANFLVSSTRQQFQSLLHGFLRKPSGRSFARDLRNRRTVALWGRYSRPVPGPPRSRGWIASGKGRRQCRIPLIPQDRERRVPAALARRAQGNQYSPSFLLGRVIVRTLKMAPEGQRQRRHGRRPGT